MIFAQNVNSEKENKKYSLKIKFYKAYKENYNGFKKKEKNEGTGNKLQSRQKWGYGRNGKNRKRRTEGKI